MALFGLKKEKKAPAKKIAIVPMTSGVSDNSAKTTDVILRPRITEKSGLMSQMGVYTFEVTERANKAMISRAINGLYKVNPVRVAIVNLPAKKVIVRGRRGTVSGVRKAMVTLKKGDKIDFV